jgi:CheY-like chemotaxis protein
VSALLTDVLAGRRLLIVEDEYMIAEDLARALRELGADVIGPAATVADALGLIGTERQVHGAVLDINLRGEHVYTLADALRARGIPFVFATGYDAWIIPPPYADVPRIEKPVDPHALARMLGESS